MYLRVTGLGGEFPQARRGRTNLSDNGMRLGTLDSMEQRLLRWLYITLLSVILFLSFFTEPMTLGLATQWEDGNYRFSGGTRPEALVLAGLIVALYIALMKAKRVKPYAPLPGAIRRFFAFWIDFLLAMMSISPIVGILPVIVEWRRTGAVQWTIERNAPMPGDSLQTIIGLLVTMAVLLMYYVVPLLRERPSPGACILGYVVIPDEGVDLSLRDALLRTSLGFVALASCYLIPFVGRDKKKGKIWPDKVFNTRAMLT
jgi:hypothetical protein